MGAEGETGATKVVNILRREFEMAMALTARTRAVRVWSSRKVQLPFRADAATGY